MSIKIPIGKDKKLVYRIHKEQTLGYNPGKAFFAVFGKSELLPGQLLELCAAIGEYYKVRDSEPTRQWYKDYFFPPVLSVDIKPEHFLKAGGEPLLALNMALDEKYQGVVVTPFGYELSFPFATALYELGPASVAGVNALIEKGFFQKWTYTLVKVRQTKNKEIKK